MLQNPSEGAVYSGILTKGVNILRNKASCFYKKGGQHPPEWQLLFLAFNHALGGSAWAGISTAASAVVAFLREGARGIDVAARQRLEAYPDGY
jgi:hypothetical protein